MLNSPILDVTIGLVFVFLLYSLLVTSINEAIASTFALRARMLRTAIAERMLSNISTVGRWQSIWNGFVSFWAETAVVFLGSWRKEKKEIKLGDKFYDHPLIKNYSSSRVYSKPSYIPKNNFSTVLIDILKTEFDQKRTAIAQHKLAQTSANESLMEVERQLDYSPDFVKVKEIIEHYGRHFTDDKSAMPHPIIDREALEVLRMHLNNSGYDYEKFIFHIETWFDDTMDRVSGWYKRQVQFILFLLGLIMAILFNVDSIDLANKLSTNTDARKIVVESAIGFQERFDKNEISKAPSAALDSLKVDTSLVGKSKVDPLAPVRYQQQVDSILKFKRNEIDTINSILALGWGDYGMKSDLNERLEKQRESCKCDSEPDTLAKRNKEIRAALEKEFTWWYKVKYVGCELFNGRKIIGLLLTAFALSLGAPFWFDMLNKLIKLRNSGVKEDSSSREGSTIVNTGKNAPVIINNLLKEEAQG